MCSVKAVNWQIRESKAITLLVGQQLYGVAEERKFSNLLTYLYLCIICTIVCRPAVFWKCTCTRAPEEDCAETWGAGPWGCLAQGRERSALNPQHPLCGWRGPPSAPLFGSPGTVGMVVQQIGGSLLGGISLRSSL